MTWRYAVTKGEQQDFEDGPIRDFYAIREVYFNEDGTVNSWTVDAIVEGETLEELYEDLERVRSALNLPLIDLTKEDQQ